MIFTFQIINSTKKYLMFAENKEQAFKEMRIRFGQDADNYSLIAFTQVERFAMFI